MNRIIINISVISLILITNLFSQPENFDEKEFFKKIRESYYTLSTTGLKNLTSLITSIEMEIFAEKSWGNIEIFPLQLIWFSPDRLYLSQLGIPTIESEKYQEYQEIVNGLKQQMKGILLDLQRFYITGLFSCIREDYQINLKDDIVEISFSEGNDQMKTHVIYLFGLNGLCLENEISYPNENKTIKIYPTFRTVKTKWLCEGWTVQTIIDDTVQSGFMLQIKNNLVNGIWVPNEIIIGAQKAEDSGNTYFDSIKIKNYLFNQSIELLNNTNVNR